MEITAAGATIGYIRQKQDCTNPIFQICDASNTAVLEVKGPACIIQCCNDVHFEVLAISNVIGWNFHR